MLLDSLYKLCQSQGHWPPKSDREEALHEVNAKLQKHKGKFAGALGRFKDVGIDPSKGVGHLPYIPWVRIFSLTAAPRPTSGYFVDFLPAWNKQLYIGILPGVSGRKVHELDESREQARKALDAQAMDGFLPRIELCAPAPSIADKYERALVLAEKVDFNRTIDENSLLERVCCQLRLLARIYERVSKHA